MSRFEPLDDVGSVVAAAPGTALVFERHGIDPRTSAAVSLETACRRRGVEVTALLAEIEAALGAPRFAGGQAADDLACRTLSAVIDYVLERHHAFAKREIPRITTFLDQALRLYGDGHRNLFPPLAALWSRFAAEFEEHMRQEEVVLFPAVRAAEGLKSSGFRCGNLDAPVLRAEWFHDEEWAQVAQMRRIGAGYVAPAGAGETWRALYDALAAFERDLHEHVRLENDVLFPRVRALDLSRSRTTRG
jgi:regulator of cell morphogenesis and NO signaling